MQPGIKRWACLNQRRRASENVCKDMMQWFGLQMWTVATTVLNKKSQTADKGWCSSLGVR